VLARLPQLRELVGDRQLVLRVDRTELSKNIVRGLEAFRELLQTRPQWRERVVHLALAYPSRHELPEYREYTAAVQRVAREINDEYGTPGWVPVHLEVKDDYARSLAAYRLADVLVVNPLRDGMNLVAKEGPVVSEQGPGAGALARGRGGRRARRRCAAGQPLRRPRRPGRCTRRCRRAGRSGRTAVPAWPRRRAACRRRPGCARSWTRSLTAGNRRCRPAELSSHGPPGVGRRRGDGPAGRRLTQVSPTAVPGSVPTARSRPGSRHRCPSSRPAR
jgi:hypothetical protein